MKLYKTYSAESQINPSVEATKRKVIDKVILKMIDNLKLREHLKPELIKSLRSRASCGIEYNMWDGSERIWASISVTDLLDIDEKFWMVI